MGNCHGRYSILSHHPAPPPCDHYKYPSVPSNVSPQAPTSNSSSNTKMALSLPYANIDSSLRALAGQAEGFGRLAIGGLQGPLYHVTTLAGKL